MRQGWKDTISKSLWCSGGSEKIMMAKDSFIALWHGGQGEKRRGVECQLAGHTQQCRPGAQDIAETPCGARDIL